MKCRGIKTIPGVSLIECEGVVHEFIAGDHQHPKAKEIYSKLKEMLERLKMEQGYVPKTRDVTLEIFDEEEKENAISYHSEKLAIAFGLISISPGKTIRITKNLRVCEDCHVVSKMISRVYGREIVVRDRARVYEDHDVASTMISRVSSGEMVVRCKPGTNGEEMEVDSLILIDGEMGEELKKETLEEWRSEAIHGAMAVVVLAVAASK
ncbi:putative DYW domain-containing protein [Dioscorea sansibarensis]